MERKMNTDEYIAWENLYTTRLEHLRNIVTHTLFDAKQGLLAEEDAQEKIAIVDEEVKGIIECGRIIKLLKEGE